MTDGLPAVTLGGTYTFYCEIVEESEAPALRLRNYTGQQVTVLAVSDTNDPGNSPLYRVRFQDGREAEAWEEELNGWDLARGQFVGPAGEWGSVR